MEHELLGKALQTTGDVGEALQRYAQEALLANLTLAGGLLGLVQGRPQPGLLGGFFESHWRAGTKAMSGVTLVFYGFRP